MYLEVAGWVKITDWVKSVSSYVFNTHSPLQAVIDFHSCLLNLNPICVLMPANQL